MSRIGKVPIIIPTGSSITVKQNKAIITGPKGTIEFVIPEKVEVKLEDGKARVVAELSEMQGMVKSILANAIRGVTEGWKKSLELSGTGFRAAVTGNSLQLALGFSHQVNVLAPEGIAFEVKENKITVLGADKRLVGQVAAQIRAWKPADPYKAKGFKYEGEIIIRKAGKAAKTGGAAGAK